MLPLDNLSPDTTEQYFVTGMYDSLISNLGKINALQVTSRTSASRVNTSQGIPFVGRKLGVANVIEGSVFREGNRVHDADSGLEFTGKELVSMNFWVCQPELFPKIESDFRTFLSTLEDPAKGEIYLPFVIQDMLRTGEAKVEVIPSRSHWFGVTYAADKDLAVRALQSLSTEGKYPSPLWGPA